MTKTYLIALIVLCANMAEAQTALDRVLADIAKNNKPLHAQRQLQEAEKLKYRTGLNLENPRVDYEHLPGSPAGAGTQKDITVTQAFDFPTSYFKRRDVSKELITQADIEYNAFRQEVMLGAKQVCIEYIYRRKLQSFYEGRMESAKSLTLATSRKVEQGEGTILDENKSRLLELEVRHQLEMNASEIKTLQHRLDELNGGVPIDVSQLQYPQVQTLPEFTLLDSVIEANDPEVNAMKHNRVVQRNQLELTRALSLPKFQGGYHRQSILNQTYQGVHFGLTIPLWENKNMVKAEESRLRYSEVELSQHRTSHLFENKKLYDQYSHWQKTFAAYNEILGTGNNEALLNKALSAGEISLIEYLMELRYFYDAVEKLAFSEKESHRILAELYKYEL